MIMRMKRRVLKAGILALCSLAVLSVLDAAEKVLISVNEYEYRDYRRGPRMEERDRQTGQVFSWAPGLEIITDLYDVEVRLFDDDVGRTPWEVDNLPTGAYRVTLNRSGFETVEFWVTLRSDRRTVVFVQMDDSLARLVLKKLPPDARVLLDHEPVDSNDISVKGGRHSLTVSAFGWESLSTTLTLQPGELRLWNYEGTRTAFGLEKFTIRPQSLPPWDRRGFSFSWLAHGAGSGDIRIFAPDGRKVATLPFVITQELSKLSWLPQNHENSGKMKLEDGKYKAVLLATGEDGHQARADASLDINSSFEREARLMFTRLPGLLYAPGSAMLPPGIWQLSTGLAFDIGINNASASSGYPVSTALRLSPRKRWEIGTSFGMRAHDPFDTTSIGFSVYTAYRINEKTGFVNANLALLYAYSGYAAQFRRNPVENPATSLPGLQLLLPTEWALNNWSIVFSPSMHLLFLGSDPDDWSFALPARSAGGLAVGLYYEDERFLIAASMALRTPDLPQDLLDWHLWSGLEGRINMPGGSSWLSLFWGVRTLSDDSVISTGIEFGVLR